MGCTVIADWAHWWAAVERIQLYWHALVPRMRLVCPPSAWQCRVVHPRFLNTIPRLSRCIGVMWKSLTLQAFKIRAAGCLAWACSVSPLEIVVNSTLLYFVGPKEGIHSLLVPKGILNLLVPKGNSSVSTLRLLITLTSTFGPPLHFNMPNSSQHLYFPSLNLPLPPNLPHSFTTKLDTSHHPLRAALALLPPLQFCWSRKGISSLSKLRLLISPTPKFASHPLHQCEVFWRVICGVHGPDSLFWQKSTVVSYGVIWSSSLANIVRNVEWILYGWFGRWTHISP